MDLVKNSQFSNDIVTCVELKNQVDSQWTVINALKSKYEGQRVRNTESCFEDAAWVDSGRTMVWQTYIGTSSALLIYFKNIAFEIKEMRDVSVITIANYFNDIRPFIDMINAKGILGGARDEILLNFRHITDEDVSVAVDQMIMSVVSGQDNVVTKCRKLSEIILNMKVMGKKYVFLHIDFELPWDKANQNIQEWVKHRLSDLDHVVGDSIGYRSLDPETYIPIIDKSMMILDNYSDQVLELFEIGKTKGRMKKQHSDKFEGVFDQIKPMEHGSKNRLLISWSIDIIYLIKIACINVILLTTGLRSLDFRNLKVGCCKPSGRIDVLYYLKTNIIKTNNYVHLPVPEQTFRAIALLEKLKATSSDFLWDSAVKAEKISKGQIKACHTLNRALRYFANHFDIPFYWDENDSEFVTHSYRSTVAGFLSESSNLAILMIRRLFGHSNNIMPTYYQRNNVLFSELEKERIRKQAKYTATKLASAAKSNKIAGTKGEDLRNGWEKHESEYLSAADKRISKSLTDKEILESFEQMLEDRIVEGTACGFLTPLGVICMRNPTDSSQSPCARQSHKDVATDIDKEILQFMSDIEPQQCIGSGCSEAMIGPWSTLIRDSLKFYKGVMKNEYGDAYQEDHFIEQAKAFVRQYEGPVRKVFEGVYYDEG